MTSGCAEDPTGTGRNPTDNGDGRLSCGNPSALETRVGALFLTTLCRLSEAVGKPVLRGGGREVRKACPLGSRFLKRVSEKRRRGNGHANLSNRVDRGAVAIIAAAAAEAAEAVRRIRARRRVVNAILFVNKTGCQWRMLPQTYGHWNTVYHYFSAWPRAGVWAQVLGHGCANGNARAKAGRRRAVSGLCGQPKREDGCASHWRTRLAQHDFFHCRLGGWRAEESRRALVIH